MKKDWISQLPFLLSLVLYNENLKGKMKYIFFLFYECVFCPNIGRTCIYVDGNGGHL